MTKLASKLKKEIYTTLKNVIFESFEVIPKGSEIKKKLKETEFPFSFEVPFVLDEDIELIISQLKRIPEIQPDKFTMNFKDDSNVLEVHATDKDTYELLRSTINQIQIFGSIDGADYPLGVQPTTEEESSSDLVAAIKTAMKGSKCPVCGNITTKMIGENIAHCTCCQTIWEAKIRNEDMLIDPSGDIDDQPKNSKIKVVREAESDEPQPGHIQPDVSIKPAEVKSLITKIKDLMNSNYEEFVSKLSDDIKDSAFVKILTAGRGDGKLTDEQIGVKRSTYPVDKLLPTQNAIGVEQSLRYPLSDVKTCEACLKGKNVVLGGKPITIATPTQGGAYVVDGHHRWSQILCTNPNATIGVEIISNPNIQTPADALKIAQLAIAVNLRKLPSASTKGLMNLFETSPEQIKSYIEKTLTEDCLKLFIKYKKGTDRDSVVNYVVENVKNFQTNHKPPEGAPDRELMPQTDSDAETGINPAGWKKVAQSGALNFKEPFVPKSITQNK